ncbi:MAG: flagellar basal body P-ring formation chaperone FlgA [Caldimicrobium sp.]
MRLGILIILLIFWLSGVSVASSFYEEKDFKEIFIKEFKRLSPHFKGEVILERFRFEPDNLKIPKGLPYQIEWIGTPRAGSNTAVIIFNKGKGETPVIRLWGYVEVKMPVPVLKRTLPRKSIITEEDITYEMCELSRLPHDVLLNKESILGKETRSTLMAGTVLRASLISEPLLIKRNQVVEIIAKGKNFIVKAKGIALENGKLNEFIRIKNLSSKKIVQGKVTGEGFVEVYF